MLKNIFILIMLTVLTYFVFQRAFVSPPNSESQEEDTTSITVYVQDKESARVSDCSVTVPVSFTIASDADVSDASLKLLFAEELSQYGQYESLTILDKTALVYINSSRNLEGLSSCEIGHLTSVLTDTLTQYDEVSAIEIYSNQEKLVY